MREIKDERETLQKEYEISKKEQQELDVLLSQYITNKEYKTEFQKMQAKIDRLQKEKDQLHHLISEKQSFVHEYKINLEALESRAKEREEWIANLEKSISDLEKKILELVKDRNIEAQRELVRKKLKEISRLENKLAEEEKSFTSITLQKEISWQQYLEAEKTVENVQQQTREKFESWRQKQEMLRKQLSLDVKNIEQAIEAGLKQYQQVCEELDSLFIQKEEITKELKKREIEQARQEAYLAEISQSLVDRDNTLKDLYRQIHQISTRIAEVTQGKDIDSLLENIKGKKYQIEKRYQKAREESLILAQQIEHYEAEKERLKQQGLELDKETQNCEEHLKQYRDELQIETFDQLLDYKVSASVLHQWETQVMQDKMRIQELEKRLEEIRATLSEESISLEKLEFIKKQFKEAENF